MEIFSELVLNVFGYVEFLVYFRAYVAVLKIFSGVLNVLTSRIFSILCVRFRTGNFLVTFIKGIYVEFLEYFSVHIVVLSISFQRVSNVFDYVKFLV